MHERTTLERKGSDGMGCYFRVEFGPRYPAPGRIILKNCHLCPPTQTTIGSEFFELSVLMLIYGGNPDVECGDLVHKINV